MKQKFVDESFPVLKQYLGYLQFTKNKSDLTCDEYFITLRQFFRYMKVKYDNEKMEDFKQIRIDLIDNDFLSLITLSDIYDFLNHSSLEFKNGSAARARKVSIIKSFFKFCHDKAHVIEDDPAYTLEAPKVPKKMPKFLSLEQSVQLLALVDGESKERDYLILCLFLNCGLRLAEACSINLKDCHLVCAEDELPFITINGKGSKQRNVYLNDLCQLALNDYLKVREKHGVKEKEALLLSNRGRRISKSSVQTTVKRYLSMLGLEDYSTHKLRHTAATIMYQHGNVDIRTIKDILGHENLNTTQIYTHVGNDQMKEAMISNPLVKRAKRK